MTRSKEAVPIVPAGVHFAPIAPELLAVPGLTLAHIKVWSHVYLQTLGRPDWTLSYRQIGDAIGLNRWTVRDAVKWLQMRGWLTTETRRDDGGNQLASLIRSTFPQGCGSVDPQGLGEETHRGEGAQTHHQKSHYQKSQPQPAAPTQATRTMDDATWLAAELDADPAACRAAIDAKSQQAERSGNPWRSPRKMIRDVIPLEEWRDLVEQHKPRLRPLTQCQCRNDGEHARHRWEDVRNAYLCVGVEAGDTDPYAPVQRWPA